jgi:hypothetical protein
MSTISFTLAEFRERIAATAERLNQNADDVMAVFMNKESHPVTKRGDNPRIKFTGMRGRKGAAECDASQCFAPQNPPFTRESAEKKLEICGIQDETTCACCGEKISGKGQGDHVWGRKEYHKYNGRYGIIDTPWNKLPICTKCNPRYKKITLTDGTKKNIGRDDLTEEELKLVDPEDVRKVTMVSKWKAYAKKRGAVLCFHLNKVQEKYIADLKERVIISIKQEERNMQRFIQESAQD